MSHRNDKPAPHLSQLQKAIADHMQPPKPGVPLPLFPDRVDRLLAVLSIMGTWVCEFDQHGALSYTSPLAESVIGFTVEECMSSDRLQFHPEDISLVIETGRKVRETGEPATNHSRIRHKQGHWVWVETLLIGWYTEADSDYHTITFIRDISDTKLAEAEHQEIQARYNVVSQMSRDMIAEVDSTGQQTYISPSCHKILGRSADEILAIEPWSLLHPEDLDRIRNQLEGQFHDWEGAGFPETGGGPLPELMEFRLRHRNGEWVWFESLGQVYATADGKHRFLTVGRDVSERKRSEEALRQLELSMQRAQKLESLGVLAGGIAHDFNNLLTPILGAASLGRDELPPDSPIHARFDKIENAARRAATLTSQMLAYAGQRPLRLERVDLSTLVRDMRELVSSSVSGRTFVDLDLSFSLPPVEVEPAQISQVIMNLISNANESLAEGQGHVIARTGLVEITNSPSNALFAETMEPGKHVYFEVTDDGVGMDAETRDKIFDPFFSTKFAGRGLGLAAVAGIVRGHRGAIEVESQPGSGTRIRVLLPIAAGESDFAETKPIDIANWRAEGTVLVVDDDDAVRDLAQEILTRVGLKVLTAADGHDGMEQFKAHADSICLVLLDRTMPAMSGAETAAAIRALRPDTRIIIVSGYSEERIAAELAGHGIAGFLQKPFSPEALIMRVHDALESGEEKP